MVRGFFLCAFAFAVLSFDGVWVFASLYVRLQLALFVLQWGLSVRVHVSNRGVLLCIV